MRCPLILIHLAPRDGPICSCRYLIHSAGIDGYGPRETALIAQIVRHQRKGSPAPGELEPPARDGDAELVARCALLLRLAEQLDRGQDQAVRAARLVPEAGDLRLSVEGDDRLARWSLERRLSDGAFRRAFGGRLVVSP